MDAPVIEVDARGHRCPTPTLRLRRALERAPAGTHVRLLADDPLARLDVPLFARQAGAELVRMDEAADGSLIFLLCKAPDPAASAQALR